MKAKPLIIFLSAFVMLQSCYNPGDIQIQNNISNVEIVDVRWGDLYMAEDLLPGESSDKHTIRKYDEKLPSMHKVSFKMTANMKTIYLGTVEEFLLDQDGDLLITLDDETKVKNPND